MHLSNHQIPLSKKLVGEQAGESLVSRLEETSAVNTMSSEKKGRDLNVSTFPHVSAFHSLQTIPPHPTLRVTGLF